MLGSQLRSARLQAKLSLVHLAATCKLDPVTIWRIEKGQCDPRFSTQLLPILVALGIAPVDFIRSLTQTRKKGTP